MRLLRNFIVASIAVLVLLIVVARVIGSTNKLPALAMLDPGNCPQPCWHGIRPGGTSYENAKEIILADFRASSTIEAGEIYGICWHLGAVWEGCAYSIQDSEQKKSVSSIIFKPLKDSIRLRSGDLINLFGTPVYKTACIVAPSGPIKIGSTLSTNLVFGRGEIILVGTQVTDPNSLMITETMLVSDIYFGESNNDQFMPPFWQSWRGFRSCKR
jgi:hypothetical protein